jgi:hypothetical protein
MTTVYRLVGYHRTLEFLEEQHDIPPRYAMVAKRAAGIAAADDDRMGDWPLSHSLWVARSTLYYRPAPAVRTIWR